MGKIGLLSNVLRRWNDYKYRFVPWIAFNLKNLKLRKVQNVRSGNTVGQEFATDWLEELFTKFEHGQHSERNADILYEHAGFGIEKAKSKIPDCGTGVFISKGSVKKGMIVALYPGTVYQRFDPIFFQSVRNKFIFRCVDTLLIDGNDRGISKSVYRSCSYRDRIGAYMTSDLSWLTSNRINPLAIGQYVNNQCPGFPSNVTYQELDIPNTFPVHLRCFIPNVKYQSLTNEFHPNEQVFSMVNLYQL
ncbi:SETD9 (predicted) [Pycnogonum litorale]